jgi:hydrogenase expression/formation protein HypE
MTASHLTVPVTLQAGKLPHAMLADLLAGLPTHDPQLLLGPSVGEDAAVIDFDANSDRLLVVKSDPITFATDQIGYYAVNVCANDLAGDRRHAAFLSADGAAARDRATAATAQAIFTRSARPAATWASSLPAGTAK